MSLATVRQSIADSLNTVSGLNVSARPQVTTKGMDGWVIVARIAPSTFAQSLTTFTAIVLLSADELIAENLVEQLAIPCVNAVTSTLNAADVVAEPVVVAVGQTATPMYALSITLSMEVD